MEKIIITDVDGVLLDWNAAFENHMINKGYTRVPGTDDKYSLGKRFGIDEKLAFSIVDKFNKSSAIKSLMPYKDSVKYVTKLKKHGFKFICVTSLHDDINAKAHRLENLQAIFGKDFISNQNLYCLPVCADKMRTLAEWGDTGYFWIEDHFKNAEAGHEVGLVPLLVDTSYNRHFSTDLFERVHEDNPWKEIYIRVCARYKITL